MESSRTTASVTSTPIIKNESQDKINTITVFDRSRSNHFIQDVVTNRAHQLVKHIPLPHQISHHDQNISGFRKNKNKKHERIQENTEGQHQIRIQSQGISYQIPQLKTKSKLEIRINEGFAVKEVQI